MRRSTLVLLLVPVLAALLLAVPRRAQSEEGHTTPIYTEQGGAVHVIDSGGTLSIKSGGAVSVASGGSFAVAAGGQFTLPVDTVSTTATATAAKSGTTFVSSAANVDLVLPAAANGLRYTFVVGAVASSQGARVFPQAGESIKGAGLAPSAGGGIQNDAATDALGDTVTLVADSSATWWITSVRGTWGTF